MRAYDAAINPRKAHSLLDRREAERAPVECQITYTGEDCYHGGSGVGTLRDLSKTGCQIIGVRPPLPGSHITLTLYLPDNQPPMCLVGSIVSQVRGHVFGVKFPALTANARKRLQALILQRVSRHQHSRRSAFRIA